MLVSGANGKEVAAMGTVLRLTGEVVLDAEREGGASAAGSRPEVKEAFRAIMAELVDLARHDPAVADPAVSGSLRDRTIEVSLTVKDEDPLGALAKGSAAIRSALRTAGGVRTPGWSIDRIRAESGTTAPAGA